MGNANVPTGRDADGRVAGRLRAARTRSFVGQQAELDLFRSALEADVPEFAVLAVHGPGGVGKTALLGRYAQLAWGFAVVEDPDAFEPVFAFSDFHRVPGRVDAGGRTVGMFARDMRQDGITGWWELIAERVRSSVTTPGQLPRPERRRLVLAQEDFAGAVRDALKHLTRPDGLADNPLLHSRVVLDLVDDDHAAADVLVDLVQCAVGELAGHPRKDKLRRALDRTYLRPAPTQEAAAEILDLPFSTYRRHLASGIDHVTD